MFELKAKDSEIKPYPLCLGNISKDFTIHHMKKTGLLLTLFSSCYRKIFRKIS